MNLKNLFFLIILSLLIVGCSSQSAAAPNPDTVTVFAAASLTDAFTQIAADFEASRPTVRVELNFAGSQTLRTQIEQGAGSDVFASANVAHVQALVDAGLAGEPTIFAQNQLAVIVPASNPAALESLADLAQPGLKLVLAQGSVPVGRYARKVLDKLNTNPSLGSAFSKKVLKNLVSEEDNVKSVVTKVRLGEADAGIVYASDITPAISGELRVIEIPEQFNVAAHYSLTVISGSAAPALAQQFADFVLSPQGQFTLVEFGFHPVPGLAGQGQ